MPKTFSIFVKPWPQTLSPKTLKPKTKGPWADTKISWATHHTHKKSKSKKGSEWSPLLVQQKKSQVDTERKDMEKFTMFSENILNLT